MAEALEVIFRSGWTFFGTIVLVMFLGWALSMPFFWWYKMKQINMSRSYWLHDYGN
tara:strand:- start:421 stop:588 length:168 start_codon:yes stop_codon:yes gene_type:complete